MIGWDGPATEGGGEVSSPDVYLSVQCAWR